MIKFKATLAEVRVISEIANRALALPGIQGTDVTKQDLMMDIEACHSNGCRLRLLAFASGAPFDFAHDIYGIRRNLNRETGKLEGCFLPRYAKASA